MYILRAECYCHKGRVRTNNEDNFLFENYFLEKDNSGLKEPIRDSLPLEKPVCYAVFDGMGGQSMGEDAAYIAAETLNEMKYRKVMPERLLSEYCAEANKKIFSISDHYRLGMPGTTAVIILFKEDEAWVCNIGDSRCYLIRDHEIRKLSVDHVEQIGVDEKRYGRKPRLTQNLGIDPEELSVSPYIDSCNIQKGDVYLLCSDGLTDYLSDSEIAEIIDKRERSVFTTERLVHLALSRGGKDNITAVLCEVR